MELKLKIYIRPQKKGNLKKNIKEQEICEMSFGCLFVVNKYILIYFLLDENCFLNFKNLEVKKALKT